MTTNITSQFHIPRGLGFAPLNVRIYRRTTKKLSPQGLQIGPRMSELVKRFFKTFRTWVDFDPLKCPDIWKDFSSHLHLDNWIPAIRGTTTAKTLHLHRRAWNAGENHGRKSTGWRPQKCNVALYFEILTKRSGKRRNFNRLVKVFFLPSSYN